MNELVQIQDETNRPLWPSVRWLVLAVLVVIASLMFFYLGNAQRNKMPSDLVFYDWEGDLPQSVLDAFYQEYGVTVIYKTYESQEEAVQNIRLGYDYDVVVMESRLVPLLVEEELLAKLNFRNLTNFRYISPSFRDLLYDPGNQYSIPFNYGTTAILARTDLVETPVTRWADFWDESHRGKLGFWMGMPREVIGISLKSLGYSANSEDPQQLEQALQHLLELKGYVHALEDFDPVTSYPALSSGVVTLAFGYAADILTSREADLPVAYIYPEDGVILWGDNFVIPKASRKKDTAELFINFLMRPQISADIANQNYYATPNEAAQSFIDPEILSDPVIFPPAEVLRNAEIILPLSPQGQKMYDQIWARFLAAPTNW